MQTLSSAGMYRLCCKTAFDNKVPVSGGANTITPRFNLTRSGNPCSSPAYGSKIIRIFERPCAKINKNKKQVYKKMYILMYNERDSLISRHEIIQDGLRCR